MNIVIYFDRLVAALFLYSFSTCMISLVLMKQSIKWLKILLLSLLESVVSGIIIYIYFLISLDGHGTFLHEVMWLVLIFLNVLLVTWTLTGFKSLGYFFKMLLIVIFSGLCEMGFFTIIYSVVGIKSTVRPFQKLSLIAIAEIILLLIQSRSCTSIKLIKNTVGLRITFDKNEIELNAYVDSGNRLRHPDNDKSVIILPIEINKKLIEKNDANTENTLYKADKKTKYFNLECHTLCGKKYLRGCVCDKVNIYVNKKEVTYEEMPVVFSEELTMNGSFQAIISSDLLHDMLK